MSKINAVNKFLVSRRNNEIIIGIPTSPAYPISKADALNLAAWIVALAEDDENQFGELLEAVLST